MLSFSQLGTYGRLGNQLFQYAFLRTQAEKLGVPFYCPHWKGDEIFSLGDASQRAGAALNIGQKYHESAGKDYNRGELTLSDNTEIIGYFESEKNFDAHKVKQWYLFRDDKVQRVQKKYSHINFSESVGLHVRLGDKMQNKYFKNIYYIPRKEYYQQALKYISTYRHLLIFSDDIPTTRRHFTDMDLKNVEYIQDNEDWEDLYLMTKCRDFICGASTLSWWGAWLGRGNVAHGIVIAPQEGTFRPGSGFVNHDFIPDTWHKIPALEPMKDHYVVIGFPFYNIHHRFIIYVGKKLSQYCPTLFRFLLPYFR